MKPIADTTYHEMIGEIRLLRAKFHSEHHLDEEEANRFEALLFPVLDYAESKLGD